VLVALPWHLWQSFRKQVDKNRVHVSASRKAFTADSAPTEVTPYKYEPLGADGLRSLRLVTLLAGLPDQHEVECHISHYALDQCPPYEALSYCWGGIRDKRTIQCNGAHFNVSANLRSALLNLRFDNRSRLLWIDAICTYSHRTTMKHLGTMRSVPQVFEGCDVIPARGRSGKNRLSLGRLNARHLRGLCLGWRTPQDSPIVSSYCYTSGVTIALRAGY
jgi:hypothetical protein